MENKKMYLTVEDISNILNVSRTTVWRSIKIYEQCRKKLLYFADEYVKIVLQKSRLPFCRF